MKLIYIIIINILVILISVYLYMKNKPANPNAFCSNFMDSDVENCGKCRNKCLENQTCKGGKCIDIDLNNDPYNCGTYGNNCYTDHVLTRDFDFVLADSCVNGKCYCLYSDPNNCGKVGNKCDFLKKCLGGKCDV